MQPYRGFISHGPGYTCDCINGVISGVTAAEECALAIRHEDDLDTIKGHARDIEHALYDLEDRLEALREANDDLRKQRDSALERVEELEREVEDD